MATILVVEDEPNARFATSELLKMWDHHVYSAEDGERALEILQQDPAIDIVLADVVMPRMDGLALLRFLKTTHSSAAVILLTAQATIENAVEALKLGAYDYLLKPFHPDRLKTLVENCARQVESDLLLASLTGPVFLSYAREDVDTVLILYKKLQAARFQPWMDVQDLSAGLRWQDAIESAIRSASFFVACLSENSVSKRGMVQKEVRIALDVWREHLESDVYLIPLRLTACAVPQAISEFQWVDYFEDDGWERLVRGIRRGLAYRAKKRSSPS
jgi:DNA-binding response OmpR family regulator